MRRKGVGQSSSNSFGTSEPPRSVTHSALDLFSSGHVLVDFQRGYDEHFFPPTNADAQVLEFELTGSKTDVGGTVIDTRNIWTWSSRWLGAGTKLSKSEKEEGAEAVLDSSTPIKTEKLFLSII